jgi:hypothetical protein
VGVGSGVSVGAGVSVGSIAGTEVGCGIAVAGRDGVAEGIAVGGVVGAADGFRIGGGVAVCEGVAVATSIAAGRAGSEGWGATSGCSMVKMAPTTASGITIAISARESTLMTFPNMPPHVSGRGRIGWQSMQLVTRCPIEHVMPV